MAGAVHLIAASCRCLTDFEGVWFTVLKKCLRQPARINEIIHRKSLIHL
jgi:hypothetical protein